MLNAEVPCVRHLIIGDLNHDEYGSFNRSEEHTSELQSVVLLLDGVFLNLSLSPCWIKAWETSPGCTCVERGGAVLSVLDHR